MSTSTVERTCMRCGTSELDHPAKYQQNVCLLTYEAMNVNWVQARDRHDAGLWPDELWEAYQRGHRFSADKAWGTPSPGVQEWIDRLERAVREPINGALYQHPLPLF